MMNLVEKNQTNIRYFLIKNNKTKVHTLHTENENKPSSSHVEGESKMKMIRRKMMESRRKKDRLDSGNITVVRSRVESKTWKGQKLKSARDASRMEIQDELIPVIVGSDVKALYPSLADLDVGLICYNAVMNSEIEFSNVNYKLATKYITLNFSAAEQRLSPLWKVLPRRTVTTGARPGVTAPPNKEDNWIFPTLEYTAEQRRTIIATMVQVGCITMMNTHVYEWNGSLYHQQEGGPIGLRATCAIARIVMNYWDKKWMNLMNINNIERDLEDRYMDDIRVMLMALRAGWRWYEGGLHWCKTWEEEDIQTGKTPEERTTDALLKSMNNVLDFLEFTKETPGDFENKKLPTLDLEIRIEDGVILFQFYEKPMGYNVVVQATTALSATIKRSTLTEEVLRRLKHTSEDLSHSCRMETLERLAQKMSNSGHKNHYMKQIFTTGITEETEIKQFGS